MIHPHKIPSVSVSEVTQTMIFKVLWDSLPSKSFISGLWLREYAKTPLWKNCFLNILPVKEYFYFKFYFGNIILCTPGERGLWEQAPEEDRISYALDLEEKTNGRVTARWDAVKDMAVELKKEYAKRFPYTYKGIVGHHYTLEQQKLITGALNKQFWDSF